MARNEETRRQAEQASIQQRVLESQRVALHTQMADRLAMLGRGTAGVVGAVGYGAYSAVAGAVPVTQYGAQFAGARFGGFGANLAAAVGGVGFPNNYGPQSAGQFGQSFYSGRSFGGVLYEAGMGQALNTLTAGVFFKDANRNVGLDPAFTQALARGELSARLSEAGEAFKFALPFAQRWNGPGGVVAAGFRRSAATRLAAFGYSGEGDLPGGRGILASAPGLQKLSGAVEERLNTLNEELGYGLTREQGAGIAEAAGKLFSDTELNKMRQTADTGGADKLKQGVDVVTRFMRNLKLQVEDLSEFEDEMQQFGADVVDKLGASAAMTAAGGLAGAYSGKALMRAQTAVRREMLALGVSGENDLTQAGERATAARLGNYGIMAQRSRFSMFGRTETEGADAYTATMSRGGTGYATSSAGRTALFQTGGIAPLMGGANFMGHMGAQASALLANPFSALSFRFDPRRQQEAQLYGSDLAYQESMATAGFMGQFMRRVPGWDPLAAAKAQFAASTGLSDSEVMRIFEVNRQREEELSAEAEKAGIKDNPARLMLLGRQAEEFDPRISGNAKDLVGLAKNMNGGTSREAILRGLVKLRSEQSVDPELTAALHRLHKGVTPKYPRTVEDPYGFAGLSGVYEAENPVTASDLNSVAAKLMASGMSPEVIQSHIDDVMAGTGSAGKARMTPTGLTVGTFTHKTENDSGVQTGYAPISGSTTTGDPYNRIIMQQLTKALYRAGRSSTEDRLRRQSEAGKAMALMGTDEYGVQLTPEMLLKIDDQKLTAAQKAAKRKFALNDKELLTLQNLTPEEEEAESAVPAPYGTDSPSYRSAAARAVVASMARTMDIPKNDGTEPGRALFVNVVNKKE